jgi:hypothetical protein
VEALGWWDAIPATVSGMAAAPASTGARQALWQQLQHCGACRNGTPPYLPLRLVQTDVSNPLEPYLKTSQPSAALLPSRPPLFGYKIRHDGRIAARITWAAAYSTI